MATNFPLPEGTTLPQGTVVGTTLTAYRVRTPEGDEIFVPFYGPNGVHRHAGPGEPLVVFA